MAGPIKSGDRDDGRGVQQTVDQTIDQTWTRRRAQSPEERPLPGLLVVFDGARPVLQPLPLVGGPLILGRGPVGSFTFEDQCMSRQHAEVALEGATWRVRDLGSRNGSAIDGVPLEREVQSDGGRVLRLGDTLFLFSRDLRPALRARPARGEPPAGATGADDSDDAIIGPTMRPVWDRIASLAGAGDVLHVTGETGAGKELAARRFHAAGPRARGPFVAVNCGAIPAALAERLLFGARRGAYSGADADADGYVQSAQQGTLFLDEIAELELPVQTKLLRVLETREVLPLGASRARPVSFGLVSATHGSLRRRVDDGRFRQDLYFRLGRPAVALPPLRERAEDIPPLIARALGLAGRLRAHASLIEAALLRRWPGNVRELLVELKEAARAAGAAGETTVKSSHLLGDSGRGASLSTLSGAVPVPVIAAPAAPPPAAGGGGDGAADRGRAAAPEREELQRLLDAQAGNVSRAARLLGVHRTQLRRWLEYRGISASSRDD